MKEDGTPKAPLGFNALVSRGYSEKHPPQDFRRTLAEVNADFVAFCAKQFVDVGIPSSRLYTHVAAPAPPGIHHCAHLDRLQHVFQARLDHVSRGPSGRRF